ncbi:GDSL esterase/lipase At5g45910-like [Abrus precatorius]|uniref:GDSL esterase/lipase At5g45910-like n=1 Tax=Abrus precatorius TaxID=3816 RepID=A0A8B8K5I7_ABRPR|nr:GDSL esterase/lipase At5g45910-like [Abrus precatorius]
MKIFILFSFAFACSFMKIVVSNANPVSYEAIFNFGDSISDTGNAATYNPAMPSNSPYGSTYFKHPSGRMSDGRLIIDFIAEAYGLPMLPAYLNLTKEQDIRKGVNFAYAGATALSENFFLQKQVNIPVAAAYSLNVQLDWFKKLKSSLCQNKEECDNLFKKSLFIVGEIGGNDINALIPYKNITALQELVPPIVEEITNITTKLIEEGAVELAVPGNFPIGCNSGVLTIVNSDKNDDYDQFGCLTSYNDFIENYNEQIKKAIDILRQKNSQVKIIYFDYYGAAKRLFQAPQEYGFPSERKETFKACCGKGEPYNVDINIFCGSPASITCSDPSKHINWDGVHFTEAAYKQIAKGILEGSFANPPLRSPPIKIE